MNMEITKAKLVQLINEELTTADKSQIKKMIDDAIEKGVKRDLSFHHPYIIDRIKV